MLYYIMAKKILIIGASKGIGRACANHFRSRSHQVITSARSEGMDLRGDVTRPEFRDLLVQQDVDVVINCVGGWGNKPYSAAMHLNSGTAVDLLMRFYDNLREGSHIFNVSSLASNFTAGWKGMPAERVVYMASKQALSAATSALGQSKRRDIRVTTIEPGEVHPTNFGSWTEVPQQNYVDFDFDSFTPYRPQDIADTIDWVIQSPPWFGITRITMNNHCREVR